MRRATTHIFGGVAALAERRRRVGGPDAVLLAAAAGAIFGTVRLAQEWTGALRPTVDIDLSLAALPRYALLSLSRGVLAYALSLTFTVAYGTWAAKDRAAARVLIPALDVLQSVPVLGFMPGLVLGLVAAFPATNVGLELASVIMIFTGQVWNMAFSYYDSVRAVPADLSEVATLHGFGAWQRFRWLELPSAAVGLVWNSMVGVSGGWFFLMVSESFVLGDHDFRLPGLGAYMSVAVESGDRGAMLGAVVAMALLVVALDQLVWRPVVVWAQRFRLEGDGEAAAMESWFLDLLRRSRLPAAIARALAQARRIPAALAHDRQPRAARSRRTRLGRHVAHAALVAVLLGLLVAAAGLVRLVREVPRGEWEAIAAAALLTLLRVLAATLLGTAWALPAGLAIGLSPRLSRVLQPVVQVVASFPAPMLFPAVVAGLAAAHVGLGWGSVLLMLLGTQWYVLFNVIAGATAIPADLREAARLYRLSALQRIRALYLPAVFPYLVTGWVTAAGGAWNASIVAEYVSAKGAVISTRGLGAEISAAAAHGRYPALAAAVAAMAIVVVVFNRVVWRRLHEVAARRYSPER